MQPNPHGSWGRSEEMVLGFLPEGLPPTSHQRAGGQVSDLVGHTGTHPSNRLTGLDEQLLV